MSGKVVNRLEDLDPSRIEAHLQSLSARELEALWDAELARAEDEVARLPVPPPEAEDRLRYEAWWAERAVLLDTLEAEYLRRHRVALPAVGDA